MQAEQKTPFKRETTRSLKTRESAHAAPHSCGVVGKFERQHGPYLSTAPEAVVRTKAAQHNQAPCGRYTCTCGIPRVLGKTPRDHPSMSLDCVYDCRHPLWGGAGGCITSDEGRSCRCDAGYASRDSFGNSSCVPKQVRIVGVASRAYRQLVSSSSIV